MKNGWSVCLVCNVQVSVHELDNVHVGAASGTLVSVECHTFYWLGQPTDIQNRCRICAICASWKNSIPRHWANLYTILAGYPMQVVAVDTLGPIQEMPTGNKYILVTRDCMYMYIVLHPVDLSIWYTEPVGYHRNNQTHTGDVSLFPSPSPVQLHSD